MKNYVMGTVVLVCVAAFVIGIYGELYGNVFSSWTVKGSRGGGNSPFFIYCRFDQ